MESTIKTEVFELLGRTEIKNPILIIPADRKEEFEEVFKDNLTPFNVVDEMYYLRYNEVKISVGFLTSINKIELHK